MSIATRRGGAFSHGRLMDRKHACALDNALAPDVQRVVSDARYTREKAVDRGAILAALLPFLV